MTVQAKEKIQINDESYYMMECPLKVLLDSLDIKIVRNKFSTACWRGYVGSWLIEDKKLYLVKLKVCPDDPDNNFDLSTIFGKNDLVFASRYTGTVTVPIGEFMGRFDLGEKVFSHYIQFKIKKGRIIRNRKRKTKLKQFGILRKY